MTPQGDNEVPQSRASVFGHLFIDPKS